MTHLYLIRHARTAWNLDERIQGWADIPLDEVGRQQAEALAERLSDTHFDAIYSSPLLRARQTAEALAAGRSLELQLDERLRERHLGEWTGLTFDEARLRWPERFESDWRIQGAPGGEDQTGLIARSAAALDACLAAYPDGTLAVVSHGGTLSAYLAHVLGIPIERPVSFSFHNASYARLTILGADGVVPVVRLLSLGEGGYEVVDDK
jgi:broad specificity phosphatase PhoE